MSAEPALLSLTEVAQAISSKRLSSREATQSCLDRITTWQPHLNAFMAIEGEAALEAADAADALGGFQPASSRQPRDFEKYFLYADSNASSSRRDVEASGRGGTELRVDFCKGGPEPLVRDRYGNRSVFVSEIPHVARPVAVLWHHDAAYRSH